MNVPLPRWVRLRELANRCKVPNKAILNAVATKKQKQIIVELPTQDIPSSPLYVTKTDADDSAADDSGKETAEKDLITTTPPPTPPTTSTMSTRFSFPTAKAVILPYATAARLVEMMPGVNPTFEDLAPDAVQMAMIAGSGVPVETRARLPIFTLLGERDHGKTTLIDRLRGDGKRTREAGNITQRVRGNLARLQPKNNNNNNNINNNNINNNNNNNNINAAERESFAIATLLDTPGHGHFFEMREETSHVGDAAVIVVAADEGPGATTWEVLDACVEANIDVVVALNKIDVASDANIAATLHELERSNSWSQLANAPIVVKISACTGDGVDDLVDIMWNIHQSVNVLGDNAAFLPLPSSSSSSSTSSSSSLLASSSLSSVSHRPRSNGYARCTVLDAFVDPGHGLTLRTVVHEGTLRKDDAFVCGLMHGRVKSLHLPNGERKSSGGPGQVADVVLSMKGMKRKQRKQVNLPRMGEGLWVLPEEWVEKVLDQRRMEGEIMAYSEGEVLVNEEGSGDAAEIEREAEVEVEVEAEIERKIDGWQDQADEHDSEEEQEEVYNIPTVVIKTDSASSLETVLAMLDEIRDPNDDMSLIHVVHAGVGVVTSTDLKMAAVDGSTVYCYNVGLAPMLKKNQIVIAEHVLLDDLMASMLKDAGLAVEDSNRQ